MTEIELTPSCGNVFEDLGLKDASKLRIKADLIILIRKAIKERGLTQAHAAKILNLKQPKLSELLNGKMQSVTVDRLLKYLLLLGFDIEINFSETTVPTGGSIVVKHTA